MPASHATELKGPPHDPHCLIRQVLQMGAEFSGPAEDVVFSWLISLAREVDPAVAANLLLDEHDLRDADPPPGAQGRLWQLLRETARYTGERLQPMAQGRRGGRRRNH
jgi:hypothetical protein